MGSQHRAPLPLGLAVLLACVVSAPAQAGTVDATQGVIFTAAPGETNNLTITQSGNSFTVADNWPLTALGPCSSTDMFTAVCTAGPSTVIRAFLGDLDDTAVIVVASAPRVDGGSGADTITVSADNWSPLRKHVTGGRGDDLLANHGEAQQVLDGGAGDDEISTHTAFSDIYGGGGNDVLDTRGTVVAEASGGPGDDRLLGGRGESLFFGRAGNDTLIGGEGRDFLNGGEGHDVIRGGRGHDDLSGDQGNDLIVGGRGREWARGGRGNDTFLMRDGYLDRVRGSYGFDRAAIDRFDRVRFVDTLL